MRIVKSDDAEVGGSAKMTPSPPTPKFLSHSLQLSYMGVDETGGDA
jgi:hypothetical protein